MSSDLASSLSPEDLQLLQALRNLAEKNGITEFGNDYLPPKYTDPNYVAPHAGHSLFVANIVLVVITCIIVTGRYYARIFVAGGLGGDDIAIGIATILFIGSSSMYCYAIQDAGFGRHFFDLNFSHIQNLLKITYAMPILYNINVFFIKLSLLLFYRRLFGQDRKLQILVKTLILFQAIYTLGHCIGLMFICRPVQAWWIITLRVDHCPKFLDTMIIYVCLRSISVFTDLLVLCLPMRMLWGLKIPRRQKVRLAVIFGLGIMTCVTAVVRLAFIPQLLLNVDVSWNVIPVAMLDELEQCLGIITASLPALTAIVAKFRGSIHVRKRKTGSSTSSFELSQAEGGEARRRDSGGAVICDFDFLSLAYDPDSVNTVRTRVWAAGPSREKKDGFGLRGRVGLQKPSQISSSSDDDLVGVWTDPYEISKTTTVEVFVDKR